MTEYPVHCTSCDWKGHRSSGPLKPCPTCGKVVVWTFKSASGSRVKVILIDNGKEVNSSITPVISAILSGKIFNKLSSLLSSESIDEAYRSM